MSMIASQITGVLIACSDVCSGPQCFGKSKILGCPTDHLRQVAGSPVIILGGQSVKMSSAEHWSQNLLSAFICIVLVISLVAHWTGCHRALGHIWRPGNHFSKALGADQRNHQNSMSLTFVRINHWWLVDSPHKWPVMWKMFPFDDVIMYKPLSPQIMAWYILQPNQSVLTLISTNFNQT